MVGKDYLDFDKKINDGETAVNHALLDRHRDGEVASLSQRRSLLREDEKSWDGFL